MSGLHETAGDAPPFRGGWLVCLCYELGRLFEPSAFHATREAARRADFPLAIVQRCDDAILYDRSTARWWSVGSTSDLVTAIESWLARGGFSSAEGGEGFKTGILSSVWGKSGYKSAVERVLEYIRAGDAYQVNLAHHLQGSFRGSSRGLFRQLLRHARPWYGGYVESSYLGRAHAVCSASPELFLAFDPLTRRVTTRPMKGTRASEDEPDELMNAEKDSAELNMIVDLMRNDLGRVCRMGSIRVDSPRCIERHGTATGSAGAAMGVLQATATISGELREGLSIAELLRAAFPAGSVTGAPKLRAMQIIDELEPEPRGPYCGSIGYISDSGHAAFSVAIRTASIVGARDDRSPGGGRFADGVLRYPVGAGIVVDSVAEAEWAETLLKARTITSLAPLRDPS